MKSIKLIRKDFFVRKKSKTFYSLILMSITMFFILLSCEKKDDEIVVSTMNNKIEIVKNDLALINFIKAVEEMNQPKYFPTQEYIDQHGLELSDERKQILYKPALELIYSMGITEEQLEKETGGDIAEILIKAFDICSSKLNSIK